VEDIGGFAVSQLCTCFSHSTLCITSNSRKDAAPIMESIWRKWDIVRDRPLQEGVERVWSEHGEKSEVVWKKTGIPYYITTSNLSA
jgi:hypothetical protein